jgi:hypothetical protein
MKDEPSDPNELRNAAGAFPALARAHYAERDSDAESRGD